jgi:glucose-6-phosphate 1-dehydrogenase
MLTIRVQPDEGISFQFNSKVPGSKVLIESVNMDFCHECKFGPSSAEAYELLLYDVMQGDQTLFTRWDEVENSWRIIDEFVDAWHHLEPEFYKPGTWGPKKADKLTKNSGRKWVIPKKPYYAGLLEK